MSLSFLSTDYRSQLLQHVFPASPSEARGTQFGRLIGVTGLWFAQKMATTGGPFFSDAQRNVTAYPTTTRENVHHTNVDGLIVETTDTVTIEDRNRSRDITNIHRFTQIERISQCSQRVSASFLLFPGILLSLGLSSLRKHITNPAFTLSRWRHFDPVSLKTTSAPVDCAAMRYIEGALAQESPTDLMPSIQPLLRITADPTEDLRDQIRLTQYRLTHLDRFTNLPTQIASIDQEIAGRVGELERWRETEARMRAELAPLETQMNALQEQKALLRVQVETATELDVKTAANNEQITVLRQIVALRPTFAAKKTALDEALRAIERLNNLQAGAASRKANLEQQLQNIPADLTTLFRERGAEISRRWILSTLTNHAIQALQTQITRNAESSLESGGLEIANAIKIVTKAHVEGTLPQVEGIEAPLKEAMTAVFTDAFAGASPDIIDACVHPYTGYVGQVIYAGIKAGMKSHIRAQVMGTAVEDVRIEEAITHALHDHRALISDRDQQARIQATLNRISLVARLAILPLSLAHRLLSLGFTLFFTAAAILKLAKVIFFGIQKLATFNPERKALVAQKLFIHSSHLQGFTLLALAHLVGLFYLNAKDHFVLQLADQFSNRSRIGQQIDRAGFIQGVDAFPEGTAEHPAPPIIINVI